MALLHRAELRPTKIELLSHWVPSQPWAGEVDSSSLESVGAYRFDDPDGEVGVETHLLRTADGQIVQVPLTYRAGALDGAEDSLITTVDHSVLGKRWVYDASVDPVYARTLAIVILRGREQADLVYVTKDSSETHRSTTLVRGSGSPTDPVPEVNSVTFEHAGNVTVISAGKLSLHLRRIVDPLRDDGLSSEAATLIGCWPGHDQWTLLAKASRQSDR